MKALSATMSAMRTGHGTGWVSGWAPVAALVLLAASRAAAMPRAAELRADDPVRLRVELYSGGSSLAHVSTDYRWLGFDSREWSSARFLQVHIEKGNWRIGTAAAEEVMGLDLVYSYAPIRLEYVIWERPIWYAWVLHGMAPEVTLQLSGYWLNETFDHYLKVPMAGRLDVVAGVDFLGLGLSLSAGMVAARTATNRTAHHWDTYAGLSPNVELRLRFLTFGADLE
jgi:hypothetical protein